MEAHSIDNSVPYSMKRSHEWWHHRIEGHYSISVLDVGVEMPEINYNTRVGSNEPGSTM